MKKLIVFFAVSLISIYGYSQNTYKAIVKDFDSKLPLPGANIQVIGTKINAISGTDGSVLLNNIPSGLQIIKISFVGFITQLDTLNFPIDDKIPLTVFLKTDETEEELDEIIISATRSSRTIDNIPTRIEVIAGEEIDEKTNMKPGDIRLMLAESTGIQTQQTSATSGNSSIRIQGLDGKYTQIIRDGFPLYSGFSGGLGLLQIAPLDLQQVEVIKGSSSTLYGAGAIAGLVNLVSKKPTAVRQLNFLLNGTSALGLDASGFYSQKFKKIGLTVYGAYNKSTAYDPAGIGLTAIPKYDRYTFNPKLYFYFNKQTTLSAGINATIEKRIGGDIEFIKGKSNNINSYFEENKTGRYSSQIELIHQLNDTEKLTFRNSLSYYKRQIGLPNYIFSGAQVSTYTEFNYNTNGKNSDWVAGLNFNSDQFKEDINSYFALRSYKYNVLGAFVQNTWNATEKVVIESGLRTDYHNEYGMFVLPRISALWKINSKLSTRLGGGLGYMAPSVFTEDAERIQFRNVKPIDVLKATAERSYGTSLDFNYKTTLGDKISLNLNQLFFYTRIHNPIQLTNTADDNLEYLQPHGSLHTKGTETNVKITYDDFKLFIGYTFADVNYATDTQQTLYPLVSKHRLNSVLMYEIEDSWKIGLEAYYFSKQKLNDGNYGKSYWTNGLMIEKLWPRLSIFLNFENLSNVRQTKFDSIYTGSITEPVFKDIYAPVDGFVVNGGLKIKL